MNDTHSYKPGDLFDDKLEIVRLLGKGGSASVFHVRDRFTNLDFALKLIPNHEGTDYAKRGRDESIALHRLSQHPNVVQVFNSGITADGAFIYIKMELLPGFPLRQVLDALKYLSLSEVLTLGVDICRAVAAAHQVDIVHRDLKPANVFVCPGNRAKVLDFGIAKFLASAGHTTARMRRWRGTPLYMAPEQLQGERITPSADVYALGVMFHEAIVGKHFCYLSDDSPSFDAIGWMQIKQPLPLLHNLVHGLPQGLSEVIARAVAKRPTDRFQNAGEFGRALSAELNHIEGAARAHGLYPSLRDLVGETDARLTVGHRLAPDQADTAVANVLEPFQRTTSRLMVVPPARAANAPSPREPRTTLPSTPTALGKVMQRPVELVTVPAEPPQKPTVPNTPVALRRHSRAAPPGIVAARSAETSGKAIDVPRCSPELVAPRPRIRQRGAGLSRFALVAVAAACGVLVALPVGHRIAGAMASDPSSPAAPLPAPDVRAPEVAVLQPAPAGAPATHPAASPTSEPLPVPSVQPLPVPSVQPRAEEMVSVPTADAPRPGLAAAEEPTSALAPVAVPASKPAPKAARPKPAKRRPKSEKPASSRELIYLW